MPSCTLKNIVIFYYKFNTQSWIILNADYETELLAANVSVDVALLKQSWQQRTADIFMEATLPVPGNIFMKKGGKEGIHTERLGYILAEMQFLQRAYPDSVW